MDRIKTMGLKELKRIQKPIFATRALFWPWVIASAVLGIAIPIAFALWRFPVDNDVYSFIPDLWTFIVILLLLPVGFLAVVTGTESRIAAYEDRLIVDMGLHRRTIPKKVLVACQATSNPVGRYLFGFHGFKEGLEWDAYVISPANKGLMIETAQRKYLVSVPDAGETARQLREIYNLPDVQITPPPS